MIKKELINWIHLYNNGDESARNSVPTEFDHIVNKLYDRWTGDNEGYDLSDQLWEMVENHQDVKIILDEKIFCKEEVLLKLNAKLTEDCYYNNVISVKDVFNAYNIIDMDEPYDKDFYNLYMKIYNELDLFNNPLKDETNRWLVSNFTMTFSESTLDYLYAYYLKEYPLMLKEAIINRFETYGFYQTSQDRFRRFLDYLDDYPIDQNDIARIMATFDKSDNDFKLIFLAKILG